MLERVAGGMPGRNDRVRLRHYRRQEERQKGSVDLRRPIDLRARLVAKSRPVDGESRVLSRQALLERAHLMPCRDRAERGEKEDGLPACSLGRVQTDDFT